MDWKDFLKEPKISTKILIPVAIFTGCLLLLPLHIKRVLSIQDFSKTYSNYIGPGFLISCVLLIVNVALKLIGKIKEHNRAKRIKAFISKSVRNLTYDEQSVLREFILYGADTISLPFQHPTVNGLVNKLILYQVGSTGGMVRGELCLSYSITEVAKEMLTPQLIGVPLQASEANKQLLLQNRPSWTRGSSYY